MTAAKSRQAASESTLVAWLDRAAGFPDAGLRFLDRRERPRFASWSEIRTEARRVAASLLRLGVRPGERVALVYPTGLDFFRAFFGVQCAGAVPVPLYPPVRLGRLEEYHSRTAAMLEASSARLLLADRRVARLLGQATLLATPPLGCLRLDQLPPGEAEDALPAPSPEDLALVQFSSGTTVAPKPVALRHRHVVAQVLALNSFWPDSDAVRHTGVSWLPLYHDMGLIGCVFPALERPSVLTLFGPEVFVSRPALWLRAISTYGATISVAPNFAYGLATQKIRDEELEGVDLSSWHVALNGAESVSPGVLRAFQRRFAKWGFRGEALTPVYGLSEATLAVTFSDLRSPFTSRRFDRAALARGKALPGDGDDARELTSVGRPLPGSEVCVVDRRGGQALNEGAIGRVEVRAPWVMDGYLDRPEATAAALDAEGWLDTGDLGFLMDGELFLTGRAKDLLIVHGRNHAPEEVEQAVSSLPGVRTGCAVAVSHLPEGAETERVLLFVERAQVEDSAAGRRLVESLPARCREVVLAAAGLRLDTVHVLEPGTLPRTSSGKLRRAETLRRHLDGELRPPEPVSPLRMASAMARSALAHVKARTSAKDSRQDPDDG